MDIMALPALPFQLVMEEMVVGVGLYKAVRLRLVSSRRLSPLSLPSLIADIRPRSVRPRDFTRHIRK